jgi:hypothetical protein
MYHDSWRYKSRQSGGMAGQRKEHGFGVICTREALATAISVQDSLTGNDLILKEEGWMLRWRTTTINQGNQRAGKEKSV